MAGPISPYCNVMLIARGTPASGAFASKPTECCSSRADVRHANPKHESLPTKDGGISLLPSWQYRRWSIIANPTAFPPQLAHTRLITQGDTPALSIPH
jgi:hypothetical protein